MLALTQAGSEQKTFLMSSVWTSKPDASAESKNTVKRGKHKDSLPP